MRDGEAGSEQTVLYRAACESKHPGVRNDYRSAPFAPQTASRLGTNFMKQAASDLYLIRSNL
jgi:hypothetical protein